MIETDGELTLLTICRLPDLEGIAAEVQDLFAPEDVDGMVGAGVHTVFVRKGRIRTVYGVVCDIVLVYDPVGFNGDENLRSLRVVTRSDLRDWHLSTGVAGAPPPAIAAALAQVIGKVV